MALPGWLRALWASPHNPLRCGGTVLAPPVLLVAKLLTLFLLVRGEAGQLSDHFLPFLPWFDRLGDPQAFQLVLQTVFWCSAAAVMFNVRPRAGALVLGLTLLVSVLSSRLLFSNNRTFIACMLVLTGLQASAHSRWLLQAQVSLLYLGAGLNKLLDPDWLTGRYFEFWTKEVLRSHAYQRLAEALPPMALSQLLGWFTVAAEFSLAVGLIMPRTRGWAVWGGIVFHTAMLLFTGGKVSVVFYYVMLAAYLACWPWTKRQLEMLTDPGRAALVFLFAVTIAKPGGLVPWPVYWCALSIPLILGWPRAASQGC